MATEIPFPVEFHIADTPVSAQAKRPRSREIWKNKVVDAAKSQLPESPWLLDGSIAVTVFFFPKADTQVDLDNMAKPILDALSTVVFRDDSQVDRLLLQRFDTDREDAFADPSPGLAAALERGRPCVYVRIDDDRSRRKP